MSHPLHLDLNAFLFVSTSVVAGVGLVSAMYVGPGGERVG